MTNYWNYENYPKKYVCIHVADCSHCNNGKGINGLNRKENGHWHGPFKDKADALKAQMAITGKSHRSCKVCGA